MKSETVKIHTNVCIQNITYIHIHALNAVKLNALHNLFNCSNCIFPYLLIKEYYKTYAF